MIYLNDHYARDSRTMKVVALISGGKDSCYNMMQCVAAGHDIVALANLRPESKDELDSYMYQTVGHQGIELYAEAMGRPLFRQTTRGVALQHEKVYTPTPQDEVEDLFQLLTKVKAGISIKGVAVGAVLSDYQRLRVENVCSRLGLVALTYLWRRDQAELLQEMIDCHVDAIVIKVAALGLDPAKHLGMRIAEIQPHLVKMSEKYGLNICGEGGEYETFTLDCPLFTKSVVIDDYETVIHSNDAIAPVGYLHFKKLRLVKKAMDAEVPFSERLNLCHVKSAMDYISDLDESEMTDCDDGTELGDQVCVDGPPVELVLVEGEERAALDGVGISVASTTGWCWFSGVAGEGSDAATATANALGKLRDIVLERGYGLSDMVCICLYVPDMSDYGAVNTAFRSWLQLDGESSRPLPVRVCLGCPLPGERTSVLVEAAAYRTQPGGPVRHTMHVQSVSHWAPANIGPYSQAIRIGDVIYVAGQIGLVPGTMALVEGGIRRQCRLALRHVGRLIKAMDPNTQLRDVVQGVCYVTAAGHLLHVRREWERRTNNAIVDYIVVPQLPRYALVEWQVWAHRANARFEYEETGCVIGANRVSLRRRWNYENTVSAVVCYVSTVSSQTADEESSEVPQQPFTELQLDEMLCYMMERLMRHCPGPLPPACSLRLYYRHSHAPPPTIIHAALARLQPPIASTVLPVPHLNHPNTFLSVCALRHD